MTTNIDKRIREHESGKNRSTKNKGTFKLVYTEEYNSRNKAREREKFFKSGEGREIRQQIITGR